MYRDAPAALDERDRAVGAILIGEALLASCERARVLGRSVGPEAWRAIRDAHDEFPEIWRSLDRARAVLARRGVNVTGYDELRPHVRTHLASPGSAGPDGDTEVVLVDPAALDDARRATDALKLAVPGTDWAAIDQRTSGLVHAPLVHRRRNRLVLGAAVAVFAVVIGAWIASLAPREKLDRRDALRRELAEISQQRKLQIIALQASLVGRCDPPAAHELARQLVMDGRGLDARQFAALYAGRCGADPVVDRWASAPLR
ncbi:MAG TPA: hypothetical protein VHT91_04615 [Kofleriaceae bacterium]|jgi:hypothetical protein|nr:hypothetical protein [Kofleriaceae bacterium]